MAATKEFVWLSFASHAISSSIVPNSMTDTAMIASQLADAMVRQWENRFGERRFLLDGQSECASCKKPVEGDEYIGSADGVKFCCIECLKATGREE